jgi:hypothetical protein
VPGDSGVEFAPDPQAERLVAAVAQLATDSRAPFVLVGGLAVAARLQTFHRATQDLDAVVAEEQQRFKQGAIEAIASARIDSGTLTVAGVPVDVIDIDLDVSMDDVMGLEDGHDRLFVSGHLFAYQDATQVSLRAASATAVVSVATSRALLVSKLSAYLSSRRDSRKHSSDGLDVYELARMLIASGRAVYERDTPPVVIDSLQWAVEQIRAHPGEMVRRLAVAGRAATMPEIEALCSLVLDQVISRRPT